MAAASATSLPLHGFRNDTLCFSSVMEASGGQGPRCPERCLAPTGPRPSHHGCRDATCWPPAAQHLTAAMLTSRSSACGSAEMALLWAAGLGHTLLWQRAEGECEHASACKASASVIYGLISSAKTDGTGEPGWAESRVVIKPPSVTCSLPHPSTPSCFPLTFPPPLASPCTPHPLC